AADRPTASTGYRSRAKSFSRTSRQRNGKTSVSLSAATVSVVVNDNTSTTATTSDWPASTFAPVSPQSNRTRNDFCANAAADRTARPLSGRRTDHAVVYRDELVGQLVLSARITGDHRGEVQQRRRHHLGDRVGGGRWLGAVPLLQQSDERGIHSRRPLLDLIPQRGHVWVRQCLVLDDRDQPGL